MQAYGYDPQTQEYLGPVECQPSPLEPGVALVPAHASMEAPPKAGEHEAAAWTRDGGWELRPDYRKVRFWHKQRPWDEFVIEEIGVYPDPDWTDQDPVHVDLGRHVRWDGERWVYDAVSKAAADQEDANETARKYLKETDWYAIRQMETGKPVPEEITSKRAAARAAVKE
jgi:hypothetical protein